MKKILIFLSVTLTVLALSTAVCAGVLSPGLDVISAEHGMTVSALSGETVEFSREEFQNATGRSNFDNVKITALPHENDGVLVFGDVAVTRDQVIKSSSLDKLRFEPAEGTESTSFEFVFDDSYTLCCNVLFTDKTNTAPTVISQPEISVFTSSAVSGEMRAVDKDGDGLYFEILDYPTGGKLKFDSKTGEFLYDAGSRVMNDSFRYRVRDSFGNLSAEEVVSLSIVSNTSDTSFCDMEESASVTAAVTMTDKGYMTCIEDKGEMYFAPDEEISRIDFLVTAMNVFGADKLPEVEGTGFFDDEQIPDKYKGYVYSAKKLGIVNGVSKNGESCFCPENNITRAEACVILNNIIGYEPKEVESVLGAPQWADSAVSAMYELGVYDTEGDSALCQKSMTKEDAAQMLYRVYCLVGE